MLVLLPLPLIKSWTKYWFFLPKLSDLVFAGLQYIRTIYIGYKCSSVFLLVLLFGNFVLFGFLW